VIIQAAKVYFSQIFMFHHSLVGLSNMIHKYHDLVA